MLARYLIAGRSKPRNIDIAAQICEILDDLRQATSESDPGLLTSVSDRLGNDFRYAIDSSGTERECGPKPGESFETGIRRIVDWYQANPEHLARHN